MKHLFTILLSLSTVTVFAQWTELADSLFNTNQSSLVGIGTVSPKYSLQINGTFKHFNDSLNITFGNHAPADFLMFPARGYGFRKSDNLTYEHYAGYINVTDVFAGYNSYSIHYLDTSFNYTEVSVKKIGFTAFSKYNAPNNGPTAGVRSEFATWLPGPDSTQVRIGFYTNLRPDAPWNVIGELYMQPLHGIVSVADRDTGTHVIFKNLATDTLLLLTNDKVLTNYGKSVLKDTVVAKTIASPDSISLISHNGLYFINGDSLPVFEDYRVAFMTLERNQLYRNGHGALYVVVDTMKRVRTPDTISGGFDPVLGKLMNGLDEPEAGTHYITIHNNLNSNQIDIASDEDIEHVFLSTMNGQTVDLPSSKTIDMHQFTPGTYIITVKTANRLASKKIVIF